MAFRRKHRERDYDAQRARLRFIHDDPIKKEVGNFPTQ